MWEHHQENPEKNVGAPEFWCPGTRTLVPPIFLTAFLYQLYQKQHRYLRNNSRNLFTIRHFTHIWYHFTQALACGACDRYHVCVIYIMDNNWAFLSVLFLIFLLCFHLLNDNFHSNNCPQTSVQLPGYPKCLAQKSQMLGTQTTVQLNSPQN